MKITHNKVGQNLNLSDLNRAERAGGSQRTEVAPDGNAAAESLGKNTETARVQLSQRAQDLQTAQEIAKAAPDVREDKVAALQKAIDEGKYKVAAKDIADRMVDEEAQWL